MSLYDATIPQMKKMLTNLDKWLEAASAHAKGRKFDPNVFTTARLAADQYALVKQVQSACDIAKFTAARLTAKEAPKHPDTETTMEELRARIKTCVAYLETFKSADFVGADTRVIPLPFMEGKALVGSDYVAELGLPNFYFHVTTAYSILRHTGVDLGKMNYIGSLNLRDL